MNTDIVENLRNPKLNPHPEFGYFLENKNILGEAANEIERLRAELRIKNEK